LRSADGTNSDSTKGCRVIPALEEVRARARRAAVADVSAAMPQARSIRQRDRRACFPRRALYPHMYWASSAGKSASREKFFIGIWICGEAKTPRRGRLSWVAAARRRSTPMGTPIRLSVKWHVPYVRWDNACDSADVAKRTLERSSKTLALSYRVWLAEGWAIGKGESEDCKWRVPNGRKSQEDSALDAARRAFRCWSGGPDLGSGHTRPHLLDPRRVIAFGTNLRVD